MAIHVKSAPSSLQKHVQVTISSINKATNKATAKVNAKIKYPI